MSRERIERREDGSGTVLSLTIVIAMVVAMLGMLVISEAVAAKQRTQDVADLASLAGAERLRDSGQPEACREANSLVSHHHLVLVSCRVQESRVAVVVEGKPKGIPMNVSSSAEAGPANEPPPSSELAQ